VVEFVRTEFNGWVHVLFAIAVIVAGFCYQIEAKEWAILLVCMGAVISVEMLNTAIERFCDHVTPEIHPDIKVIKDVASGAVLVMAFFASVTGLIVFWPYISA
jgi:diacylglycerol kinase